MLIKENIKNIYTLSPMQEGMYFHSFYDSSSPAYFEQTSYRLHGDLNIPFIEKSLNDLFKRYDILRTVFVQKGDKGILQVVLKERNVDFSYEDISAGEDKEAYLIKYREGDRKKSFDLGRDVLMRVSVFQLARCEYEFTWSFHHILMDGWCVGILISEFFDIYHSYLENRPPRLAPVVPYRTYIQWLEKQDKEQSKNYWKKYLEDYEQAAVFPGKKTSPKNGAGYSIEHVVIGLDPADTLRLNRVAARYRVTVNTVTQSVWGYILGVYCGRRDVIFGGVVSGRPPAINRVETMVGLFINTVPIRIRCDGETTFSTLLKNVQREALESEPHHYFPLPEIQSLSKPKQHLIDHIVIFQNYPVEEQIEGAAGKVKNAAFRVSNIEFFEQTNYDFNLIISLGDQLTIKFEYNANSYEREWLERTGKYFERVLKQILTGDELYIRQITLLSEEEKKELIVDFNDTTVDFPAGKTLDRCFAEQVERTPYHIAVIGPRPRPLLPVPASVTYRELNEASNRLARLLREKGVGHDTIAGIMGERSIETIVGILGILKAGGAYLPIDPEYPENRINYMLADSNAGVLLTTPVSKIEISNLSSFSTRRVSPTNLAYVIYTSGTTGYPKGALIEHKNVVRLLFNDKSRFDFNEKDVWTLFHSFSFDFSVWEMYGALLYGGQLVVITRMTARDPGQFLHVLKDHNVTVLNQTPAAFYNLIDEDLKNPPGNKLNIRYIILGGDALTPVKLKEWKKKYPGARLVNMFGITETTVHVTYKEISDAEIELNINNIGKPIPTLCSYILDRNLKLVPIGVCGELCVGGEGVARGYLNRPGLTSEKFVENPYKPGELLYRSGDLARMFENGEMEYSGRIDHQVQIRGFRIEPGEIENQLSNQPGIKKAIITAGRDEAGGNYLCAYIVSNEEIGIPGLRNKLAAHLPGYMIPSYFVRVENIPLTPNGKIDREALPAPEAKSGKEYIAPRDKVEEKLAAIWSEILHTGRIGIDDNFFELGGHSLKAINLISKIHQVSDVKIPVSGLFKTPTIRGLSQYIKKAAKDRFIFIEAVEKKEYYALSSAQKRLYFLQQMDLENTGYNIPLVLPLGKNIEKNRLETALNQLIAGHESLRTSFMMIHDEPAQRIHEEFNFKIEYYDASQVEVEENFIRPFDLSRPPLMRSGLIKRPDGHHTWMLDMHHIVSDGTSHMILSEDFFTLSGGEKLEPPRIQYKDFTQWQNRLFASGAIKGQEDYWLTLFQDAPPRLELPTDYRRPDVFTFTGANYRFMLEREEALGFKTLGSGNDATLFMNFLAALNTLFYRYTGQTDIVIGSSIAGRPHANLQHIVGMFVNTLAMRGYPHGEKTYKTFLEEVAANSVSAFENQDVQFEELVEKLAVERDLSRNPLFDILMVVQNFKRSDEGTGALPLRDENPPPTSCNSSTAKFDMTFFIHEFDREISINIEYYTAVFREETIQRLVSHFKQLIKTVSHNPTIKLKDIDIISEAEKQKVLYAFNDTARDYPKDKTLQRLFAEQVERTPALTALVGGKKEAISLTYRELNERAGQLAYLLMEKGVRPGTIVGIMVERCVEMIIGLWGILKAGGAYLPIDPDFPGERINYMLSDSRAKILLTTKDTAKVVNFDKEMIYLNSSSPRASLNLSEGRPFPPATCNLHLPLAYVIYTSGSTGRPKGVMITHRSAVNFITGITDGIPFGEKDRILSLTTISFDIFGLESFLPLTRGSRVVIGSREQQLEPAAAASVIIKEGITIFQATPSRLKLISVDKEAGKSLSQLKYLLVGGEAFPAVLLEEVKQITGAKIYNLYGPTETTIWSTIKDLTGDRPLNIGKPIANTFICILDHTGSLQLPGVPGELCIGGAGIARGYLNNPGLTAERFIEKGTGKFLSFSKKFLEVRKPFFKKVFGRRRHMTYKTGDLARWQPDGDIEFLGRIDNQVKIRGFRIELGEIENQLSGHKDIAEAVVIEKKERDGDNYLTAYIVTRHPIPVPELKEYLSKKMPDYMMPPYFVSIDKIPLTTSGKVDIKGLPDPEFKTGKVYTAPRDEIEKKLVEIWSDALGRDPGHASRMRGSIGIDDNFFELGGHSLKVINIISRIHQVSDVKIPVSGFFKIPTIRGLAEYITAAAPDKFISIPAAEKKEYYPLSSAQKSIYIQQQKDKNSLGYNMSQVFISLGAIDKKKVENIFRQLIQRHDGFRTSFGIIGSELVQEIHDRVNFNVTYDETAEEKAKNIVKRFIKPFRLDRAPLLRLGLIKVEEKKHIWMFDMHHLVYDGASFGILLNEFTLLYGGEKLSPLRLQYKDFVEWQSSGWGEKTSARQKAYWQKVFAPGPPELNLPADFARPRVQTFKGDSLFFEIDEDRRRCLRDIETAGGATLFMVLIALYYILLFKLSGQEDIVIGTPVAGRGHAELHQVIGMFVNTLAIRNYPAKEKSFKTFLGEVRKNCLQAFENQDYPFEDLVAQMPQKRDISRNPLFDVLFILQNNELPVTKAGDLQIKPFALEKNISHYDLMFSASEGNNTVKIIIEYSSALYKRETIERVAKYYTEILTQVIDNKNIKLKNIKITHKYMTAESDPGISMEKEDQWLL